jgi:hypothetical protein
MIVFRRRLFWKVYLALLSSLVAVAVLIGGLWALIGEIPRDRPGALTIHLDDHMVPERDSPAGAIDQALRRLGDEFGSDVSLYDARGALIAAHGEPIEFEPSADHDPAFAPRMVRIDLADGRVVVARLRPPMRNPTRRILSIVLIVVGGVGLAAFPITARLTRRLEGLRSGVEQWGGGQRRRRTRRSPAPVAKGPIGQREPRVEVASRAPSHGDRALARSTGPGDL